MCTESMKTNNAERRNTPFIFCNFEGPNEHKFSCILPFNNSNKFDALIETLSAWYSNIDAAFKICGSQSEIMTACSWFDNEAFDLSVHDDYFIISKEKKAQSQQGSTVWIVWVDKYGRRPYTHVELMDCRKTFEDLSEIIDNEFAFICETEEAADELMVLLSTVCI